MTANNALELKQELLDCVESVAATFGTFPWENKRAIRIMALANLLFCAAHDQLSCAYRLEVRPVA